MGFSETFPGARVWLGVIAISLSACAPVIRPTMTPSDAASHLAEFWEAPTDLEARDLLHRLWGVERAPDPTVTYAFLRKKEAGQQSGRDGHRSRGREWRVKQGTEAQPEVVLSHVLGALGYHQPPVYYLPLLHAGRLVGDAGRARRAVPPLRRLAQRIVVHGHGNRTRLSARPRIKDSSSFWSRSIAPISRTRTTPCMR